MAGDHARTPFAHFSDVRGRRTLARSEAPALERAYGLVIPLPGATGRVLQWAGGICLTVGLGVWLAMAGGTWQNLAGAVALDLGGTLWLLGWSARAYGGRPALNPLTGLLAMYGLRRLLGLTYVLGQRGDLTSPYFSVPTGGYIESSAKAELLTLLGTAAFFMGWQLASSKAHRAAQPMETGRWQARQLWGAYLVGLIVFVAELLAPERLAAGGSLLAVSTALAYGAAFALLAFNEFYRVGTHRQWLVLIALLPLMATVLNSGMKSAFFVALLPVGAAYGLRKPSRAFALATAATAVLLLFVFPYVEGFREANWQANAPGGVTPQEVSRGVFRNLEQEGAGKSADKSFEALEQRLGSINEAGAVVYFSDSTGHIGPFFLTTLPYAFVPRFLWPGKPTWDPSGWFTAYLGDYQYYEGDAVSSTALHLAAELYWMMGWPGTIAGMLLLGFYYRRVNDFMLRKAAHAPVFLAAWYGFMMLGTGAEELRYTMALVTPAIIVVNAHVISKILAAVRPKRGVEAARGRAGTSWVKPARRPPIEG